MSIPREAVEAAAKRRFLRDCRIRDRFDLKWDGLSDLEKKSRELEAEDDLTAAIPHLLAAFEMSGVVKTSEYNSGFDPGGPNCRRARI